jgi:hypothetical protein
MAWKAREEGRSEQRVHDAGAHHERVAGPIAYAPYEKHRRENERRELTVVDAATRMLSAYRQPLNPPFGTPDGNLKSRCCLRQWPGSGNRLARLL